MSEPRLIEQRLERETGTLFKQAPRTVALVYPSPYAVGMSSLGFQTVYRRIHAIADASAERAFLPESGAGRTPLLTYESRRPVGDLPVIAFSVAYELEIAGVIDCVMRAGLPVLAAERDERHPFVLCGGPLTYANAAPLAPFSDAIVLGEAEEAIQPLVDLLFSGEPRATVLRKLAAMPGVWVPREHGAAMPEPLHCPAALLPAVSCIWTEDAALTNMLLVEAERGCSRPCAFCVMSRHAGAGARFVPMERVVAAIPAAAHRVGLIGAAVSDHPHIVEIVRQVVEAGREVSLSSLRPDRVTSPLVALLKAGGLRTLTVAADGASQRLRDSLDKGVREEHLLGAAALAREHELPYLKVYVMIGVPGEQEADLDELADLALRLCEAAGPRTKVSFAVSPFVPKMRTPLATAPFAGIRTIEERSRRLRDAIEPRCRMRAASSRWAYVEYALAQGGPEAGLAVRQALEAGGGFGAWRRALASVVKEP